MKMTIVGNVQRDRSLLGMRFVVHADGGLLGTFRVPECLGGNDDGEFEVPLSEDISAPNAPTLWAAWGTMYKVALQANGMKVGTCRITPCQPWHGAGE